MAVQASATAFANAEHTVEMRLARWLLMCHDRVDGDDLALTHEFLSMMLGVRRPGVTTALHILEGNGLIRAQPGADHGAKPGGPRAIGRQRLRAAGGRVRASDG